MDYSEATLIRTSLIRIPPYSVHLALKLISGSGGILPCTKHYICTAYCFSILNQFRESAEVGNVPEFGTPEYPNSGTISEFGCKNVPKFWYTLFKTLSGVGS